MSKKYRFVSCKESQNIISIIGRDNLAAGRGHKVFFNDKNDGIIELMNELVEKSEDHGIKNLPQNLQNPSHSFGCGNRKGNL